MRAAMRPPMIVLCLACWTVGVVVALRPAHSATGGVLIQNSEHNHLPLSWENVCRGGAQADEDYEEELEEEEELQESPNSEEWTAAPVNREVVLESVWRSRMQRSPRCQHPAFERFYGELSSGRIVRGRLLSPSTRARLIGTAILAFERARLADVLRSLPRVSRGQRLVLTGAPHSVQEALTTALARALGAEMVVIDEQRLRRARRQAQAVLGGEPVSKEEAVRALARLAREQPMIVWVRDDSVSRSRKAAAAMRDAVLDESSKALYLFASTYRRRLEQRRDDEETPPPSVEAAASNQEEEEDEKRDEQGQVSTMFERALKELASRVAQQAKRASAENHPSRDYLEALGEALGDEAMLKALAESWAPMLKDPHVKVHVALSVGEPSKGTTKKNNGSSKLRDVLAANNNKGSSSNNKRATEVPASLLQWMSVGGENNSEPPQPSSDEAESLAMELEELLVEEPTSAEARRDWERWAREDERKWRARRNAASLRHVLSRAGLEPPASLETIVEASPAAHLDLRDDDARHVVVEALKVQLAAVPDDAFASRIKLSSSSLSAGLAERYRQADVQDKSKSAATVAQDKHERALAAHVVSPRDVAVSYASIGGLEEAKRALREAITYPLKYPELYSEGVAAEAVKGVLLFGPPGTGKTLLAKAVATEGGASFLSIDASAIENKWLGESEKNAKAVFSLARRLAPCVVFLDEIDSLLSSREGGDDTSHGTLTSVKTTLMQEWDGLRTTSDRVVVIGSTNRPYDLDEAVLRRMPRRILVDLPDLDTRAKILDVTLRDNRLAPDVNLTKIAAKLEGYSGSDVKEVCREAVVRVANAQAAKLELATLGIDQQDHRASLLRPVSAADFDAAISKLKSSVAEHGPEMTRVLEWNEQYGEVKKKSSLNRAAASLYL